MSKEKQALFEAALQFILTFPPKDFNLPYFHICIMSGRIDEATKALNDFVPKPVVPKG